MRSNVPTIISTIPAVGATGVSVYRINLTFSEAVDVASGSIRLECGTQGDLSVAISGGPLSYTVSPAAPMPQEVTCRLTVVATGVSNQDDDDPPDKMAELYNWNLQQGMWVPIL